jgi:hypothetical protein
MTARIFASIIVAFIVFSASALAAPEKPNPAFAGKIMLSDKRYPQSAKSLAAFNATVNKQSKTAFVEDKDKKGTWKIYFAGFLKAPLNDVEYIVKIHELTAGKGNQLLVSFEQFTDSRGQTALMSSMVLEKKMVGVNKELLITLESKGKMLAQSRFKIVGEGERYTGKVNFSEDDAKGKKTDDD